MLKSHVLLQAEHLAEHVGADIAEHLTEHESAGIAEHEHGTNFPSLGSFQELAQFLEFFFHILENFPGYIVFTIFSQLHLCSNAFLSFSNSSLKFTFVSITFTKLKDKVYKSILGIISQVFENLKNLILI